jgi:thymidine kinase
VTREGPTIMIADTGAEPGPDPATGSRPHSERDGSGARYRVLCRRHFRMGLLGPIEPG